MLDTGMPIGIRCGINEMIMMHMRHTIQLASVDNRLLIYSIRACHIQGNGIEGSKHSHIGYNGNIIFRMAVTVRGNIHHQADMEMRTAGNHRLAVFGNFAVQDIIAFIPGSAYRIFGTHTDTTSAAHTFLVSMDAFPLVMEGASWAQILIQRPQPIQFSCST